MSVIKIVYFASIREQLALADESMQLPEGVATVAQLSSWLQYERGAKWQSVLSNTLTLTAVNQQMVSGDQAIVAGDEIAFFPPVTGG